MTCGTNPVHNGAVTVTDAQDTDHDIMMTIMLLQIAMVSLTDVDAAADSDGVTDRC